jgi:phenylacetate-CoA ligase
LASAKGYQLRWWRYGRETDRLVSEILERDQWTARQWREWLDDRLTRLLHRAATQVPYYRDHWSRRRRAGDRASWEVLENWPILEKTLVREHPTAFLADSARGRRLYHEHTSGTTGSPLSVYCSRDMLLHWYSLNEARAKAWYGVSRFDRWAILGGKQVVATSARRPPFWVWNAGLNQLYLSAHHLAPDLVPHYIEALRRYRIRWLYGYSSMLTTLAEGVLQAGCQDLQMTVAVTNAEPLYPSQRRLISEAFRCPVRETYGMSEYVAAASECEQGQRHLWPSVGQIEIGTVTPDGFLAHPAGESGEMVCTGLLNFEMPLIRYRVGDHGTLSTESERCPCGRSLPRLTSIDGRHCDLIHTPDGREIGIVDTLVFKQGLPVQEAQLVQTAMDRVVVRFVRRKGFRPSHRAALIRAVESHLAGIRVELEEVDRIPRTANGKFRGVLSQLSASEIEAARRSYASAPACQAGSMTR